MSKIALDVLETLLASPEEGLHWLRESRDFWDDYEPEEMEALWDEFVAEMDAIVEGVTAAWGPPDFRGRWDDSDYPEWAFHDRVACWHRNGRFAYVGVRHEDKELPIELMLGVTAGAGG